MKTRHFPALVLVFLVGAALACGSPSAQDLGNIASTTRPTNATSAGEDGATSAPAATRQSAATRTPRPTSVPATATLAPDDLALVEFGFGQDGRQTGYAFIVENPNPGISFESAQYQVAAFDAAGVVVETDSGYLNLVLPGERLGKAGTMFLDEGVTIDHIEVQISQGRARASDPVPQFEISQAVYRAGDYSDKTTAVIKSPYDRVVTNVFVSVVPYNDAGGIIGGGFTFANFIPAQLATGLSASTTVAPSAKVARVDVYATVSGLTSLTEASNIPPDAEPIILQKFGYGQNDNHVGFAVIVENPNTDFSVAPTPYRATAYAADGTVIDVEEGYINLLLPKQVLGIGSSMLLDDNQVVDRFDVQVGAGDYEASGFIPAFSAENVSYQHGSFSDKVTAQIVSPYSRDITNVQVWAVGYDADGNIIGGGFSFLDFVPANGKGAAEISVDMGGTPNTVEVYAAVSSLSDIKGP